MNRKLVFALGIMILLSSLSIGTVFADCKTHCSVSYTASSSVSHSRAGYSYNVTVTVVGLTDYNCSVEGDLPPNATCYWTVRPDGGNVTVDYHIERPTGGDIDGSRTKTLPYEGQELLDDLDIEIPINSIAITVTLHGHLFGNLAPSAGSVDPDQLEWSTWGTQETIISASVDTVDLDMSTTYSVYFTVCVSVDGFEIGCADSPTVYVEGIPIIDCIIPEFPFLLITPLFMIATLLAATFHRRRH